MKVYVFLLFHHILFFSAAAQESLIDRFLPSNVNFFEFSLEEDAGRRASPPNFFIQKSGESFLYSIRENGAKPYYVNIEDIDEKYIRVRHHKSRTAMFWLQPDGKSFKLFLQGRKPDESSKSHVCRRVELDLLPFLFNQHDGKPRSWIAMPHHTSKFWFRQSEEEGQIELELQSQGGTQTINLGLQFLESKGFPSYELSQEDAPPLKITFNHWNSIRINIAGTIFDASPHSGKADKMDEFSATSHKWHQLLAPAGPGVDSRSKEMWNLHGYISGRLRTSIFPSEWIPAPTLNNTDDYFRKHLRCEPPKYYANWQLIAATSESVKKGWQDTPVWISKEWPIKPGEEFESSLQKMKEPAVVFIPQPRQVKVILPGAVVENVPFLKNLSTKEFKVLQPK